MGSRDERTGLTRFIKEEFETKSVVTVSVEYQSQLKKSICCCIDHHLGEMFTAAR